LFDVIEGVVYVPEVVFEPVQAFDAVQLVVFVDDHVSFDVPPDATDVGDADNVSVGAVLVDPVTVTEAVRVTEPPLPVHVSVKLEFAVSAFVVKVPERAVRPDHAPEAAQLSAYADFQVSCDVEPDVMEVGDADNVSTGTAAEAEIGAINNRAPERTIDETWRRRNPPGLVILYAHHATNAEHPAVSMLVCKPVLADELSDYPAIIDEGVAGPFVCASPQSCFYSISAEGR
jgi:hypothetical protein